VKRRTPINWRLTQTPYSLLSHCGGIMAPRRGFHNRFVEAVAPVVSAAREPAKSLKFFIAYFFLNQRFNVCNLFPSLHLLREGALRAIGVVLHTKVLVNLKQSLLVRGGFQELFPARVVSEQARCSRFEAAVR
jgi:hypothetical protein